MLEYVGTFILTNDTLDRDSERILPEGVKIDNFLNNPVMFYNHHRSVDAFWSDAEATKIMPRGRWENTRLEGVDIIADAWVKTSTDEGKDFADNIKLGLINTVSVGVRPEAWSDAIEDKVEGQIGVTITKCELLEASFADIPCNPTCISLSKSISQKTFDQSKSQDIPVVIKTMNISKIDDSIKSKKHNTMFDTIKSIFSKSNKISEDMTPEQVTKSIQDVLTSDKYLNALGEGVSKSVTDAMATTNKTVGELVTSNDLLVSAVKTLQTEVDTLKGIKEKKIEDKKDTILPASVKSLGSQSKIEGAKDDKSDKSDGSLFKKNFDNPFA